MYVTSDVSVWSLRSNKYEHKSCLMHFSRRLSVYLQEAQIEVLVMDLRK